MSILFGFSYIEPLIASFHQAHHPDWRSRFTGPKALPENTTQLEKMTHRLAT